MSSNAQKQKMKGKLVVYIGRDEGFFQTLKTRFAKQFPRTEFSFHEILPRKKEDYQKVFLLAVRYRPAIIYIDFSEERLSQLKLAQLLTRENSLKNVPTVGLVETKANIQECISSGVKFTHVKCGEYHDVVFDPFYWAFPKETTPPSFAKAKMSEQVQLINDFRIGYITKEGIHAEGDIPLEVGDEIKLNSQIPRSNVPSSHHIVKSVEQSNLYYDFRYCYDLDFVFVDEPKVDEENVGDDLGEEEPEKREKAKEQAKKVAKQQEQQREEEIRRAKKRHLAWLKDKMIDSHPKKTKILMVDPGLRVFEDDELIESYPYTIRTQSFLTEELEEINRLRPHIIAFQFIRHDLFDEKEADIIEATESVLLNKKDEEKKEPTSDSEQVSLEEKEEREKVIYQEKENSRAELARLMNHVKSIEDYNPFVVVYNSFDYTSQSLKENFEYTFMMSNKGHINLKTLTDLAQVFQKKQEDIYHEKVKKKVESLKKSDPHKYRNLKYSDFDEDQIYIRKDNPLSYASYSYPIELESMTESELTFKIDKEIDHCVFRLDYPVPLTITLVPNKGKKFEKDGKFYQYKALIHSVDEDDKKLIRKAINEVFFDPIKKEREKEDQAYQKVHEKALKELEEQAKERELEKEREEKQLEDFPERPEADEEVNEDNQEASNAAQGKNDDSEQA